MLATPEKAIHGGGLQSEGNSSDLNLVGLTPLLEITSGKPEIAIGLIDGPVAIDHPGLTLESLKEISGTPAGSCADKTSVACAHGTFVAGILAGRRGGEAPAICPRCTLLITPIFAERATATEQVPSATPAELASAIFDVVRAGARVINLSMALVQPSARGVRELGQALDLAARESVLVVAAAGNQGTVGSTVITRHPWVIPVVACDGRGQPLALSNVGSSIGRRGLAAPGDGITSLEASGGSTTMSGTSVAAPFVTGALALLWSIFPRSTAAELKMAIGGASTFRRRSLAPPLMHAQAAYRALASAAQANAI